MGITGVPATRFEAACASSGSAFFHAVSAVAAGLNDLVLVSGVEKMTSQTTPKVTEILAGAGDTCGEGARGRDVSGAVRDDRAAAYVSVRNHPRAAGRGRGEESCNGAKNPQAHMRKVITMEQALNGKPISRTLDRLRLLFNQRWRGRRFDRSAGARVRVHKQAGEGKRHRPDLRSSGARSERRHYDADRRR